jgi:hypothetical protein
MTEYERIKKVLNLLFGQVMQGLIYFYCARSLDKARQESQLMEGSYFFFGVYRATIREAVFALSRIMIEHKDGITIHYLFNLVEQNARQLSQEDHEGVRNSVSSYKVHLQKYATLIESVREQRDRVAAHLDRKHVNNPSALFLHLEGVLLPELGKCLWEILDILNFYASYYGDGRYNVSDLKGAIEGEVNILLGWMQEHGRQEDWKRPPLFDRFVIS